MTQHSIGVDIGGTNISIALVDAKGNIKNKVKISTEIDKDSGFVIKTIIENIKLIIKDISAKNLTGIGIGAAGQIDHENGMIQFSPNLHWRNVHIVKEIRNKFKLPVAIDNDANVACYGEFLFGAGQGASNVICVTLGTGVGGGIIIDRKIYRGINGSAGEIGHITVESNGRKCNCGNRGCMEAYVGAPHIKERTLEKIKSGRHSIIVKLVNGSLNKITPKRLEEAALYRDKLALEIWQETGFYLGTGLASLINILNPEKIIIGGGVAKAGPVLFDPLRDALRTYAGLSFVAGLRVVPAALGGEAGLVGAAALLREQI